ncbi:hypothetical protein NORO109296_09210 [Nocardiopsis rhodophaea]
MHPRTLEEGWGPGSHSPGTASPGETAWSAWVNTALAEKKRRQERAQILIEQDLVQAGDSDTQDDERAMRWAQGITGGSSDEAA